MSLRKYHTRWNTQKHSDLEKTSQRKIQYMYSNSPTIHYGTKVDFGRLWRELGDVWEEHGRGTLNLRFLASFAKPASLGDLLNLGFFPSSAQAVVPPLRGSAPACSLRWAKEP
ncbi:hypothetical protein F5876DRAFT_85218 [Lentinula aff. lateritia]|uniref:Uncharacterized protein n=1 Tax=Lentinula aff. lateritia TaxID=2804960 RepID=A0ACC1TFM6_9AGAR|nr:hypothetical protein F5876DRAFT_85218 [Lentinula aff. lateritia]